MELAVIRQVDFPVDSSLRSVNFTSYLMHFITHHPLHAMMTKYAADNTAGSSGRSHPSCVTSPSSITLLSLIIHSYETSDQLNLQLCSIMRQEGQMP